MGRFQAWLTDIDAGRDSARLSLCMENGERIVLKDAYLPYFYIVCSSRDRHSTEEIACMVLGHPNVADTKIEERSLFIERTKAPVVRVTVDSTWNFGKVVKDMAKVPGIKEIAETKMPHYFRYAIDKGINFFHVHEIEAEGDRLVSIRDVGERGLPQTGLPPQIIELSMTCNVRPKEAERSSPGGLNSFLHMAAARRLGYIIPDNKKSIERPKSLRMLSIMDRGGLIFYPEPGLYRHVAKCDFASMYPNIIVSFNISPEKMHCGHEGCSVVPESGWTICKEEKGMIPLGLGKVLERRLELKKQMKEEKDLQKKELLDRRQSALKMILVCSFGYLGFKNFVFSNVECKECVMLYGREILLRTKGIAEECGLDVIYGIVDSVFVKGGTEAQYRDFVNKVSDEIGITLELDCIFRSIAFPAAEDTSGIANKYYGITREGGLECRGIALRHSDAPALIKEFQEKAIRKTLQGDMGAASAIYREYEERILRKDFALEGFIIEKSMRRDPEDYVVNAAHVVAFRQAPNSEKVSRFVYAVRGPKNISFAKISDIDCEKYVELLERAHYELLRGVENRVATPKLRDFC